VLLLVVSFLLSACGGQQRLLDEVDVPTPVATTDPAAVPSTPPQPQAARFDIADIAPDEQAPSLQPRPGRKDVEVQGREQRIGDVDPQPERRLDEPNGVLPEGLTLPDGSEVFVAASRYDGENSYLVVQFSGSWQDAAGSLRSSLEAAGWSCFSCLPFEGRTESRGTAEWRYLLNMEKGGRKLAAVISERGDGAQADVNFNAGRSVVQKP
jgi:hypothetical protein